MSGESIKERTRDINRCQGVISKYIRKMRGGKHWHDEKMMKEERGSTLLFPERVIGQK